MATIFINVKRLINENIEVINTMEQQNEINNESESNNEGDKTNPETNDQDKPQAPAVEFKKPIFIGKIGKLPTKVVKKSDESKPIEEKTDDPSKITNESSPADDQPQTNTPKPYKEPAWSDIPPPGNLIRGFRTIILQKQFFRCAEFKFLMLNYFRLLFRSTQIGHDS